jgi:DNA-binding response OmpR family regulator
MQKKLLLIEDDKNLAKMYAKKFGNEGWEVVVCHDGSQAPAMAQAEGFDMIVLDLMLPGLPGIDILEMIRSDKRTVKVPVVVYTNYGDKYNREKCLTYGADEFVLKVDSTPDSLSKTISRVYESKTS